MSLMLGPRASSGHASYQAMQEGAVGGAITVAELYCLYGEGARDAGVSSYLSARSRGFAPRRRA